jgi:Fic family protein
MKPFIPENLPPSQLDYTRLVRWVGEASSVLARYDGLLQALVNPEVLLSPLTTREAVLSSKIEGTQATLDEVLQHEAGMSPEEEGTKQDIQEIVNYRSTLIQTEQELSDKPFSLVLIRQMHAELMNSVRGADKTPGRFRETQNWIGRPGTPIEQADYIPPEPHLLPQFMEDLVNYIQIPDSDVLIQAAIIHAQFEIIHPFLDGNGRIGRLLIPLFLYNKKRLRRPMFYLSEYLESHRSEYYAKLKQISASKNWNDWIEFFLVAVKNQSKKNIERVQAIIDLHRDIRVRIRDLTRTQYAIEITDALFHKPVFRASDIQYKTNIPKQTLMPILRQLSNAGMLVTLKPASGRSPAVMKFPELLAITEK